MADCRKFSLRRLLKSFTFAGKGVLWIWMSEPNFRVHCVALVLATIFGFTLKISLPEWIAVIICSGMVLGAEAVNSAIEVLADATHPEPDPLVGQAKDAAAGAVLLVAVAAFAVGAIIFLPKLWQLISTAIQSGSPT